MVRRRKEKICSPDRKRKRDKGTQRWERNARPMVDYVSRKKGAIEDGVEE